MATILLPYPRRLALPEPPSPPLLQFVVLSLLLHALIVVLFGTPERAGIRGGAFWRDEPLAVTLRASAAERESMWRPSFGAESGGTGSALSPRARSPAAVAPAPRATTPAEPALPPESVAPAERAPEVQAPQDGPLPQEAPTPGVLPRLDMGAPEVVDQPIVPEVGIRPQEAPTPAVPRVELEPPGAAPPPPPVAPPRRETPQAPPIVERPAPPQRPSETTPKPQPVTPAEPPLEPLRKIATEAPTELTPLLRVLEPEPFAAPRPAAEPAPQAEPAKPAEPAAKQEIPVEAPQTAPDLTPKITPAEAAPAVETPRVPPAPITAPPRERASAPAEPIATPAPPAVAPRETLAEPVPVREAPKIESEPYRAAPVPVPPTQPPIREAPPPPAQLNYGAPPADDIFAPRAPSSAIDADAARKAARDTARAESRRTGIVPLNLFPPAPEKESKLARDIQKAAQPDCRDAYAAMGLLAIPFLLKDTVTDTGCRW